MAWLYGFNMHMITNHLDDIVAANLTPANTDDSKPVRELPKGLFDKLLQIKAISLRRLLTI